MNELEEITKLLESAKSYSQPIHTFIINWQKFETVEKLESGGARVKEIIKPIVNIVYE